MVTFLESPTRRVPDESGRSVQQRIGRSHRPDQRLLRIGLVNNMPDSALLATERQFTRLALEALPGAAEVRLFHIPAIPRQEEARQILSERYQPVDELYRSGLDVLIVTGNEPRAANLDDEPYWNDLTELIDWAAENTRSTLWSCLAAHAAVLHLDGIQRHGMSTKKSGVLNCLVNPVNKDQLPELLSTCHSRLNEVRKSDLTMQGYDVISEAGGDQVDIFSKSFGSEFVFLQGHPEYDADSLMREYRRDVGRYLNGQREIYPEVPENYFDDGTVLRMENYRTLAENSRCPELFESFPASALRQGLESRLASSASAVFQNWLAPVRALVSAA